MIKTARTRLRTVFTCAVLLSPTIAAADPFDIAYGEGMAAWEAKDYAKARDGYQRAYAFRPEPEALYAIAQTYRMEGKLDEAIAYYERYLGASGTVATTREKAQNHLDELKKRRIPVIDRPTPPPKTEPTQEPPKKIEPEPDEPKPETVRRRRIPTGSKIAAGVTGAALVSTAVFTVLGLRAESDLAKNTGATQQDEDRVERLQDGINISLGVTIAAAATTVILYYATPSYAPGRSNERRSIAVAPIGDGWGAFVGGRF